MIAFDLLMIAFDLFMIAHFMSSLSYLKSSQPLCFCREVGVLIFCMLKAKNFTGFATISCKFKMLLKFKAKVIP